MDLSRRIARFFFFFGLLVLVIFVASDVADVPRFDILFLGLGSLLAAILLARRGRGAPQPSERFRFFRWLFSRRKRKKKKADTSKQQGEEAPS